MGRLTAAEKAREIARIEADAPKRTGMPQSMRTSTKRAVTAAETAARFHAARGPGAKSIVPPVYATDGIVLPRRKRRVLLDLAPETVATMLTHLRLCRGQTGDQRAIERLLVTALEETR